MEPLQNKVLTMSQGPIHSSLLQKFVNYDRKKFYRTGPRAIILLTKQVFLTYRILSSLMHIQVQCAPEFHNDFWQKKIILFFKNNIMRIHHCKFIHHRSHLKPFFNYLPCIVCREYFSIIFHVKKCTVCSIKYSRFKLSRKSFMSLP